MTQINTDDSSRSEIELWQQPEGCRYISGDVKTGEWWYCQQKLKDGARLGDPLHPPYCEKHTRLCMGVRSAKSLHMRAMDFLKYRDAYLQSLDPTVLYAAPVAEEAAEPTDVFMSKLHIVPRV
jgi:hypothetical protein